LNAEGLNNARLLWTGSKIMARIFKFSSRRATITGRVHLFHHPLLLLQCQRILCRYKHTFGGKGMESSHIHLSKKRQVIKYQCELHEETQCADCIYCCVFVQEEYEAARAELIEELNRGVSLEKLRAKLTKAPELSVNDSPAPQSTEAEVPEDLVQVQAYIRWEKAGKPNYPPEKQQVMHQLISLT
jgi:hypothetical protein